MKNKYDLSIIVPCYNEEANVESLYERIKKTLDKNNINGQIIFINDASIDKTKEKLNYIASKSDHINLYHHNKNLGLTAGWDTGLQKSSGKFVCFIDADLQNPPEEIGRLYREIKFSNVDLVQGFRSTINRQKTLDYFFSRTLNFILNFIFRMKLRDNKSGFVIALKDTMIQIMNRKFKYYLFHTFITISANSKGFSIREVETLFQKRYAGVSYMPKLPIKIILMVLSDILKGIIEFKISKPSLDHLSDFLIENNIKIKNKKKNLREKLLEIYFNTSYFHKWMISKKSKNIYYSLKKTQWLSQEKIISLQEYRLNRLITHAYNHVPYYRNLFNNLKLKPYDITSIKDLKKINFLSKTDVRENLFFDLFSDNHQKNNLYKISTSGSTGEPFIIYVDRAQLEFRFATTLRCLEWTGWKFGDKQVRLWHQTIGMSFIQTIKEKLDALLMRRLFIPAYEMNEKSLKHFVHKIIRYNPILIDGYAESFNFLAQYLAKNNIPTFNPKAIMTSAQMLTDDVRNLIQSKFNCKVYDKYGSREFSGIAYECEYQTGHHIMGESYIVEIIKDGKPAKPGEIGEVIITDLNNFSMPLIRYRIGDLAVAMDNSKNCRCGRGLPRIGKIEGRTQAIIVGANKTWLPGTFFSHFFKEYDYIIRQYQVIQRKEDSIELKIIKGKQFNEKLFNEILIKLKKILGKKTEIIPFFVNEIPMLNTGKRTAVISKLNLEFQNLSGNQSKINT